MGNEEGVVSTISMSESPLDGVSLVLDVNNDSSEVETLVGTRLGEQLVNSIESLRREAVGLKEEEGADF